MLFFINKESHIHRMNFKCEQNGVTSEFIYIASELADNMLKAETKGSIEIFPEKKIVINRIKGTQSKFKELSMFLSVFKFLYNNKELMGNYRIVDFSNRGFLTMFFMGWELSLCKLLNDEYEIIARKL